MRNLFAAHALLIGLVAVIFGPVIGYDFVVFDNLNFIFQNPQIVDPASSSIADLFLQPHIGYIVPFTGLVEAALWAISGGEAWSFHLTAVLLHALAAATLLRLGLRLTGELAVSLGAAVVFALHPIAVEPVAWATGLKDLLMVNAALGATLFFLRHVERIDAGESSGSALKVALFLAALAALAKPTGAFITLGWGLFLLARWVERRHKGDAEVSFPLMEKSAEGRTWRTLSVVFVCAGLLTIANAAMHNTINVSATDLSGGWQAWQALGWHLEFLAWPDDLFPRYPIDRHAGFDDWHTYLGLVASLIAAASIGLAVWKSPRVSLGLGLALGAYLPVSNLSPFPRMVADSYVYTPLAGLLLAAACALTLRPGANAAQVLARHRMRVLALIAVMGLSTALAARTADQVHRWSSPIDLWYPAAEEYGPWTIAWVRIVEELRFKGEFEHAVRAWEQLYAREYPSKYLHRIAITLVEAERYNEAECVMIEDIHFGPAGDRTFNNLAVLLVTQPGFTPRHPAYARRALFGAANKLQAGKLKWPPELISGLRARLAEAQQWPETPATPWVQRSCPVFQAKLEPGPPK